MRCTTYDNLERSPYRFVVGAKPRRPGDVADDVAKTEAIPEVSAVKEQFRRIPPAPWAPRSSRGRRAVPPHGQK